MKKLTLITLFAMLVACQKTIDKEAVKKEVFDAEKAFEKMTSEKGVSEAFAFFADENAVIKRQNDTLIHGKENIKKYYEAGGETNAEVSWTADFIEVSDCGNLAYTYGRYLWKIKNKDGEPAEFKGVFHTVWKRQANGSWKYVWD